MLSRQSTALVVIVVLMIILIGLGLSFLNTFGEDSKKGLSTKYSPTTTPTFTSVEISTTESVPKPTLTSTATPTQLETTTQIKTNPTSPTPTQIPKEEGNYDPFLGYLAGQFARTSTPLRVRGVRIFDSNDTMWLVYNGTDASQNYTRLVEWGMFARAYGFALRAHEESDAPGETPVLLKVVEANTSNNPESTFKVTSGFARLYAYNNISSETFFQSWFQTLRNTTEQEQRRASKIDGSFRNVTYYPNGSVKFMEPPKSQESEENNSTKSGTDESPRLTRPAIGARRAG